MVEKLSLLRPLALILLSLTVAIAIISLHPAILTVATDEHGRTGLSTAEVVRVVRENLEPAPLILALMALMLGLIMHLLP